MKAKLKDRYSLIITSAFLILILVAGILWQYNSAEAVKIECSDDYLSIGTSLSMGSSDNIDSPQSEYSSSVISEKSLNQYEIEYPGSGGKIEIGDVSKTGDFKPDLVISTWDKQAEFKLIASNTTVEKSQFDTSLSDGAIAASSGEWKFEYKPTEPKAGFNDKGGLDIFITAKEKPISNSISFSYLSDTVSPYFQPPLTEEYKDGWSDEFQADIKVSETQVVNTKDGSVLIERPEYVVDSIAFYADMKAGDMDTSNTGNYRSGKVGHLYRMKAVDAKGNTAWFDWSMPSREQIQLVDKTGFLQTATYPVVIQPVGDTFGYTTIGANENAGLNYMFMGKAAPTSNGTVTSISVYISTAYTGNAVKCALYNASTLALVATTEEKNISTAPAWFTFNVNGNPSVTSGTNYWIVFWSGGTAAAKLRYDTGAPYGTAGYKAQTYGSYPDPLGTPNLQPSYYSIYASYATGGGGYSISNTPSSYNFGEVTPNNTISTGLNYFTVTNNSASAVKITISGTDITGGTTWTLSDTGTAGTSTFGLKAGLNGVSYNIVVKKTAPYNTLVSSLASSASQLWGFQLLSPTNYTDSNQKTGTITLTATTP
jgi:hypothetical protein